MQQCLERFGARGCAINRKPAPCGSKISKIEIECRSNRSGASQWRALREFDDQPFVGTERARLLHCFARAIEMGGKDNFCFCAGEPHTLVVMPEIQCDHKPLVLVAPLVDHLFFFQAQDGIRALYVTGVQTCALPISTASTPIGTGNASAPASRPASSGAPGVETGSSASSTRQSIRSMSRTIGTGTC